ncbi:hypothetical protein Efla_003161 [Eimeria flavescens]
MNTGGRPAAGPPFPKSRQSQDDPKVDAEPIESIPKPGSQNWEVKDSTAHRLKRDSSTLQELEAGAREANERDSLNARLFELGTELRKVRRINDILEAENADLRERVLHQLERYPDAIDIRALARRCGPDLAKSVSLLIEENKALRLKLQASIRAHARLQGTAADLGEALREQEERAYARDLLAVPAEQEDATSSGRRNTQLSEDRGRGNYHISSERGDKAVGGDFVKRYCACSEKLQELLDCIDSQLGCYERGVWQTQVNVLEEERDSLMLKTVMMRQRLAEVQARIVSDPFLASRFGVAENASGAFGLGRGRNAAAELRDTMVQLATAQDVNAELEKRLAHERNISRSWQSNLRALQRELRDHLADLSVAARASGLKCDMFRGTLAQAAEAAAIKELQGFTRSEKESLRLLRLARDRIAADAQRIESYALRVRELEQEVADLRCDMTRLEKAHTEDGHDNDEVSDCDENWCAALHDGNDDQSDVDCSMAALRTAKQLLSDRAEAKKALALLEDRKRELRERRERFLGYAGAPLTLGGAEEEQLKEAEHVASQSAELSPKQTSASDSQPTFSPTTTIYDALTTDKAREIYRRLMVLRGFASNISVSVGCKHITVEKGEAPADESGGSQRVTDLQKLQKEIDRREISLQQAEEAIQARAALRRIEAEHTKTLQQKEAEFEEQRRKLAQHAHEQMLKQQKEYEAQLAKERDRCESLQKELELQAKELDLQRHMAEESIRAKSYKEQLELEEELRKVREQQRQTEMQLQQIVADAARETSAIKSAATQEKVNLSAAVQAAERKASEALKQIQEKEREVAALQEKLKQTQGQRAASSLPPMASNHGLAWAEDSGVQGSARQSAADRSPKAHFKKMVLEKFTSLASAFRHMDIDHSGTVKLSEFANFVDDLGMNIPFSVTHDLYEELAAPCDGMLMLSSFYKNLQGETCTLTELYRRLEEIFGNVEQPFDDAGIPPDGRVTKEQFTRIADEAGLSPAGASDLWNSMDRSAEAGRRGSVTCEAVCERTILSDNVELDEVERVEQGAAAMLSNVLNVFSGSMKAPRPEAKISRRSSFKRLSYSAAHRSLGFSPAEAQADDVLASTPPWDCIYPEDRKAMIADMKARTVGKGQLIQAEDDPNCPLLIILEGTVNLFQPGFIQYSLLKSLAGPCLLYSDNVIEGTPSETCAKADKSREVSLCALDRGVFARSYKRLLIQRQREVEDYQALLRKVPVVNKLQPSLLRCIASSFRKQTFHPDEEIIAKGDPADHVLMVKDGEAVAVGLDPSAEEVEVRVYRPLDFFGDGTMLKGRVHTASVRARTQCTILSIESEVFYSVLQKLETEFRRRSGRTATVEGGYTEPQGLSPDVSYTDDSPLPDSSPSTEDRQEEEIISNSSETPDVKEDSNSSAAAAHEETLVDSELIERLLEEETTRMREECGLLLEAIPVLKDLPKERRQEICSRVTLEIYSPHQAIVLQGEAPDKFYIVESGTVSIELYVGCGKMQKLSEMSSGSFFGEMSLIHHEPRTAYIIALTPVYVYALKAADFEELLGDTYEAFSEHAKNMYSQKTATHVAAANTRKQLTEAEIPAVLHLLSGTPVIKLLSLDQLKELVRVFQVMDVGEREVVMHEGDVADRFYILVDGLVSIQKSPQPGKPRKEVAVAHSGEYLGEIAFLNNQPRTASCVAKSKVKLLYLDRDEFNKYLGQLSEAFLQHAESVYSAQQTDMPAWLLDAQSQGALYDPGASQTADGHEEAGDDSTDSTEPRKQVQEEKKTKNQSGKGDTTTKKAGDADDSKKKKKKAKDKDKGTSTSSAVAAASISVAPGDLDRLRDLLAGTFKNKYGSLAHAFAAMDVNNSDIVDSDEFYAFIKKSNVRGFHKQEVDAIFDELCRPIKGRLVVGNLYRNARGVEPSGAEIHLRAVEIYGSALAAFKKVANIGPRDLCSREMFASLAASVGVDNDKAEDIWTHYAEGVKSSDDRITLSTLIGLMSGKNSYLLCDLSRCSLECRGEHCRLARYPCWNTLIAALTRDSAGGRSAGGGEAADVHFTIEAEAAHQHSPTGGKIPLNEDPDPPTGFRVTQENMHHAEACSVDNLVPGDLSMSPDACPPHSVVSAASTSPWGSELRASFSDDGGQTSLVSTLEPLSVTEKEDNSSGPSGIRMTQEPPSWISGLVPRQLFSSENTALTNFVYSVESWMTSAFKEQQKEDNVEQNVELSTGRKCLAEPAAGDGITEPASHQPRINEGTSRSLTQDAADWKHPALPEAGMPTSPQGLQINAPSVGRDPSPRILLHLCEQPEPILWNAGGSMRQHGGLSENASGSSDAHSVDPRYLHVPLPALRAETEDSFNVPLASKSLNQIAEDVELWLLERQAASNGEGDGADGSLCSSDSSEEEAGQRLFDLTRFSQFFMGSGQSDQEGGVEPEKGEHFLKEVDTVPSANLDNSSSPASSAPSAVPKAFEEHATETKESKGPGERLPRDNRFTFFEEINDPGLVSLFNEADIHVCKRARRTGSSMDLGEGHTNTGLGTVEGDHELEKAAEVTGSPDSASEVCDRREPCPGAWVKGKASNVGEFGFNEKYPDPPAENSLRAPEEEAVGDNPISRNGASSELTTEEAAAKEASLRSLGNRIWAFFGGNTGAEDTVGGGEAPASGDAVEETIPFEDPAVVQRDDHRAFPNETQLLLESLRQQPLLQALSPQQQKYVASLMRREVVAATSVAQEGAEPALLWCSSGEFEVTQAGFFGVSVLRIMAPGDFFGLEELVAGEKLKCALTPRPSSSECVLWVLDKELFTDSVKEMLAKREAFVPIAKAFLHMVPLVRDLPDEQVAAVAKACKVERFAEGQTVFKMGFHGDMLCFIYKGEAITQKPQDDGGLLELARQGRGEYFGEMALIRNARRTASVVAGTELILLCLDKDSFETLLAPLKDKMAARAASSYKRQDDAPPTEVESKSPDGSSSAPVPGSRDAGDACVKKRTRKNSLALLNYSKIRDQEKQTGEGQGDVSEEKPAARWRLAQEPETIHEPPPLTAAGGRSCLKTENSQSRSRTRKSPVRFDEGSLLPSDSSDDD